MTLGSVLYTVIMVIMAFIGALVVTKTVSKFFRLDEKIDDE